MSKKNELLHIGILLTLIVFTFVGIILGIVGYSRTNNYYFKPDGETIYCNSNIWMSIRTSDNEFGNLFCSYNKPNDYKEYKHKIWDGKYPKGYFD